MTHHRATKVAAALVLITSITLLAPPGDAASNPDARRILYVRAGDIYSVRPDGSGEHRLTHTGNNGQPAWSPSGHGIVFVSRRDGDMEIFTMGPAGGDLKKLTHNGRIDTHPSWSPDGARIAFVRDFRFLRFETDPVIGAELWLMDANGGAQHRFHLGTGGAFDGFQESFFDPVWSPNGAFIAGTGIEWAPTQDNALWVRDVVSGDATLVVGGHYSTPAWTRSGAALACTYDGLYRFPPNGPGGTLLMPTTDSFGCFFPGMSGGSRFVSYVTNGVLRGRELATDTDVALTVLGGFGYGSGTPYCSATCWAVRHPYDWSPSGRLMAAATPDGIRVVAPDNSTSRLLPVRGTDPNW